MNDTTRETRRAQIEREVTQAVIDYVDGDPENGPVTDHGITQADIEEEVKRRMVVVDLEDVSELLADVIAQVERIEVSMPDTATRERLRQVRAQLEMTANNDHSWLGGGSFTLADVIAELNPCDRYGDGPCGEYDCVLCFTDGEER